MMIRGPVRHLWSDRNVVWTIWESAGGEIQVVHEDKEVTFPVMPGERWWGNPWGITVPTTIIKRAESIIRNREGIRVVQQDQSGEG